MQRSRIGISAGCYGGMREASSETPEGEGEGREIRIDFTWKLVFYSGREILPNNFQGSE